MTHPLRPRSRKNSRPLEDVSGREAYKAANRKCEIEWFLDANGIYVIDMRKRLELNHIFGGLGSRCDNLTNWIVLGSGSHDLFHTHESKWRVVCIATKVRKREFDPVEFKAASGMYLEGWLEKVLPVMDEIVLPVWRELKEFSGKGM